MHTATLEWNLGIRLEDGSHAVFWLEILPDGLTRYYDERCDRELHGLEGAEAALHLIRRVGSDDPAVRERLHRRCEFSGEFLLPPKVVAKVRTAEHMRLEEVHVSPRSREAVSAEIRSHFIRQVGPILCRYRFAAFENQL